LNVWREPVARIGLIGDYDSSVPAHQAIPAAIRLAADELKLAVDFEWVPTIEIAGAQRILHYAALWCVPASPYRSIDGALLAIRFARENHRPFLGTCGGFQHAIVEYARNVLGWADAEHGETSPDAQRRVITLLECALIETTDAIRLRPGSRIAQAYGREEIVEGYRCRYGLNPEFLTQLTCGPLRVAAEDRSHEVRAVELDDHPFFVATLFQPERAALKGQVPPLIAAFVRACARTVAGARARLGPLHP
jgi:CTP synthase (UTP-ammonia lyase)